MEHPNCLDSTSRPSDGPNPISQRPDSKVRHKVLLHCCELCPDQPFPLSRMSKPRPSNPSVQRHVEKEHPGTDYQTLSRIWGHRVYYEDRPAENIPLPPKGIRRVFQEEDGDVDVQELLKGGNDLANADQGRASFDPLSTEIVTPKFHLDIERGFGGPISEPPRRVAPPLSRRKTRLNGNDLSDFNFGLVNSNPSARCKPDVEAAARPETQHAQANMSEKGKQAPLQYPEPPTFWSEQTRTELDDIHGILDPQETCADWFNGEYDNLRSWDISPFDPGDPFLISTPNQDSQSRTTHTSRDERHDLHVHDFDQIQSGIPEPIDVHSLFDSAFPASSEDRPTNNDPARLISTPNRWAEAGQEYRSLETNDPSATTGIRMNESSEICKEKGHFNGPFDGSHMRHPQGCSFPQNEGLTQTIENPGLQQPQEYQVQVADGIFDKSERCSGSTQNIEHGFRTKSSIIETLPKDSHTNLTRPSTPTSTRISPAKRPLLSPRSSSDCQGLSQSIDGSQGKHMRTSSRRRTISSRSQRSTPVVSTPTKSRQNTPKSNSVITNDTALSKNTIVSSAPLHRKDSGPLVFPQVPFNQIHPLDRAALTGSQGEQVANLSRVAFFGQSTNHPTHPRSREKQLIDMISYLRLQRDWLQVEGKPRMVAASTNESEV